MPESFLRLPQVRARVGLSRSTIYLRMQQGEFPTPVPLGTRAVAWLESEVDAWIAARVAACCAADAAVQQ